MHFCTECQNMYYVSVSADNSNKLNYYCRHCGHSDDTLNMDSVCVSKTQIKKSEQSFNYIINKYTKLDPTLPRINNILCPNPDCNTNTKDEPRGLGQGVERYGSKAKTAGAAAGFIPNFAALSFNPGSLGALDPSIASREVGAAFSKIVAKLKTQEYINHLRKRRTVYY